MSFLDNWDNIKREMEMEYLAKIRCTIDSSYEFCRYIEKKEIEK